MSKTKRSIPVVALLAALVAAAVGGLAFCVPRSTRVGQWGRLRELGCHAYEKVYGQKAHEPVQ